AGAGGVTDGGETDADGGPDAPTGAGLGTSCTAGSECASNQCVDGVCCESDCTGTCSSCALGKTGQNNGLCRPVTNGTNPDDECAQSPPSPCGNDGMCDGAGACRKWG